MLNGLLGAIIVGSCCSLIGVFVVLRGMSYIGAGIAHGCLAGVALAFLMGWNPLLLATIFALIMVILIETISKNARLKMDTAIGVLFSIALALAVLFIGMFKSYAPDLMSYLFGSLLRISTNELWIMAGISCFVFVIICLFYKEIIFSTFDPEMAAVMGIPSSLITLMLTVLMGLTIVISLQAVGELLVLALIVLPASTAYNITTSIKKMIIISISLGVFASITGLILSYYLEKIPSGSIIVITLGLCFAGSLMIKNKS